MNMNELIYLCIQKQASDLHISAGARPLMRVHGSLELVSEKPLTSEEAQKLVFELLNEKQKKELIKNWELDCSLFIKSLGRFRCNVFIQRRGIGACFRFIAEKIKTIEELGLPVEVRNVLNERNGLIVVTGATGSGKSTTLAALIHAFNEVKPRHIITIEDPIEFVYENQGGVVNQREVSSHTKSFSAALRAALREDPDIILIGEMRDLDTIELAVRAAETGILVFGTLHTNSASKTVDRIIQSFPATQQQQIRMMLSESMRYVIAQDLLKRSDQVGRVAVVEVLKNTSAVSNLIRESQTFQIPSVMQTGSGHGMITFENCIRRLTGEGKITQNEGAAFLGNAKLKTHSQQKAQVTSIDRKKIGSIDGKESSKLKYFKENT